MVISVYKALLKYPVGILKSLFWRNVFPLSLLILTWSDKRIGQNLGTASNSKMEFVSLNTFTGSKIFWDSKIQALTYSRLNYYICWLVNADDRVKLKENEKFAKYLHFVRERKEVWNIKVVAHIINRKLWTFLKGFQKRLEELNIWGKLVITSL